MADNEKLADVQQAIAKARTARQHAADLCKPCFYAWPQRPMRQACRHPADAKLMEMKNGQ